MSADRLTRKDIAAKTQVTIEGDWIRGTEVRLGGRLEGGYLRRVPSPDPGRGTKHNRSGRSYYRASYHGFIGNTKTTTLGAIQDVLDRCPTVGERVHA